jgi:hypothetical protein
VQALSVHPRLAADARRRTTLHLAADDDEIPIDPRRRVQNHVGVDGDDPPSDVAAQHEGTAEHGNVPMNRATGCDLHAIRRSKPFRRVE